MLLQASIWLQFAVVRLLSIVLLALLSAIVFDAGRRADSCSIAPPAIARYTPPMRLRSDIFVSALIRRVFGLGGFAAIERKGAEASGAIFVRQRFRDGRETLFAPALQMFIEEEDSGRWFERRLVTAEREALDAVLAREQKFDSDLWIVEIELDQEVEGLLPLASAN